MAGPAVAAGTEPVRPHPMDRLEVAVGELVRRTAEARLQAAEDSVAELVRQEVAALSAARLSTSYGSTTAAGVAGGILAASRVDTCSDLSSAPAGTAAAAHIQKTIWEAVVLVGLPHLGPLDTAILMLGFVSTLSIQLFICNAIGSGLLWKSPIIGAIANERRTLPSLQSRELMPAPGALVGSETCTRAGADQSCPRKEPSLGDGYTGAAAAGANSAGSLDAAFCLIAAFCWVLLVGRELWNTHWSTRSMWALPKHSTQILWVGNKLALGSISPARLLFGTGMSLVRLGVAGALFSVGLHQFAAMRSPAMLMVIIAVLGFALDVPRRAAAQFIAVQRFKLNLRW